MRHLPPGSPVPGYLRRLLLADGAAGRQLFRRLYQMSTALMDSLVRAGLADPGADPAVRVGFLLANDLAVLLLREHLADVLGVDPLSGEGMARWAREVLTISSRHCVGHERPARNGGARAPDPQRRRASARPWHARWPWRFAALALALAGLAMIVLWLTGGLTGTSSRALQVPAADAGPASLAARVQARAAAWITAQVSGNAMVACYPRMCAALQEQGVGAGRLMPLQSAAASPLGASVLVTSPPISGQIAGEYAPALIASFGSGGNRVEVRAVEPGGISAYRAALRADRAARRAAGFQLLRNPRIRFIGPVTGQTGLSIEFAAPSPLGLLSPVLETDSPRPAAADGASPPRLALLR